MNKIYYLSTCDTCKKIIKGLPENHTLYLQDIKSNPITEEELDFLKTLSGSYEALFSKKAVLYKTLNLKEKTLTETDYKNYLLEHYTFLSRPVFVIDNTIYIGNTKENILNVMKVLSND